MSGPYGITQGAICNSYTYCPTCITGPGGGVLGIGGVAAFCKRHEMISRERAEAEYGPRRAEASGVCDGKGTICE